MYMFGAAARRGGNNEIATVMISKAIELNPLRLEYSCECGEAWFAMGEIDEAITCYQKALQLNSNDVFAANRLVDAIETKGNLTRMDTILLPSVFRKEDGKPRFLMPIPISQLHDIGINFLFRHESISGGYEYPTRCFLDSHLEPGDLFIDVGAHWGVYSLTAATRWPGRINVLAIEPSPANITQLAKWIEYNHIGNEIEVVNAAAGAISGKAKVHLDLSTMGHTVEALVRDGTTDELNDIIVPLVTIDELISPRLYLQGRRTILKIDTEGYEQEVIDGARTLLDSGLVVAIILEKGHTFNNGPALQKVQNILECLEKRGFSFYRFPQEHDVGGPLVPFGSVPGDVCNVFCLPKDFPTNARYDFRA